jgi:hypothetical protein
MLSNTFMEILIKINDENKKGRNMFLPRMFGALV